MTDAHKSYINGIPNKREKDWNCPFMSGLSSLGSETFSLRFLRRDLSEFPVMAWLPLVFMTSVSQHTHSGR